MNLLLFNSTRRKIQKHMMVLCSMPAQYGDEGNGLRYFVILENADLTFSSYVRIPVSKIS